jgi:hypothetical protein
MTTRVAGASLRLTAIHPSKPFAFNGEIDRSRPFAVTDSATGFGR